MYKNPILYNYGTCSTCGFCTLNPMYILFYFFISIKDDILNLAIVKLTDCERAWGYFMLCNYATEISQMVLLFKQKPTPYTCWGHAASSQPEHTQLLVSFEWADY